MVCRDGNLTAEDLSGILVQHLDIIEDKHSHTQMHSRTDTHNASNNCLFESTQMPSSKHRSIGIHGDAIQIENKSFGKWEVEFTGRQTD